MIWFLFIIVISLILQIQFLPGLHLKLDLMVLVTVYWGLLRGWRVGLGVGLVAGILQDFFSGGLLGLSAVGLSCCGLLAGYCRKMLLLRYWLVRITLVFLLTSFNYLGYFLLLYFFTGRENLQIFLGNWGMTALGNTAVAALIFWLQDRYG